MANLEITDVKIYHFDASSSGGKILAYADVTFAHALVVKGFKVIESKTGGLFVGFPSRKNKEGAWRETVIATDDELKKEIRDRVVEAYKEMG